MIGIEVHFSDWIAIDECIDADFVLSRLEILEWCDESPRLKWRVLKRPCDWGFACPLMWFDELIDGTDIHVILIGFLEYEVFVGVIGFIDADELTIGHPR
jgi:hypothetical protein